MVSGGVITGVGFNVWLGLEGNPASSPNVVAGAVLDEVEGKTLLPTVLLNIKVRLRNYLKTKSTNYMLWLSKSHRWIRQSAIPK